MPGFLNLLLSGKSVCVCVCMHAHVSPPPRLLKTIHVKQRLNNQSQVLAGMLCRFQNLLKVWYKYKPGLKRRIKLVCVAMCSLVMSLCSRDIITMQYLFNLQHSTWFMDGRTSTILVSIIYVCTTTYTDNHARLTFLLLMNLFTTTVTLVPLLIPVLVSITIDTFRGLA